MIEVVENFLTEQECKDLIELASPNLTPSNIVLNANGIRTEQYDFRNSQDYYVRESNEVIDTIKQRINTTLGIPVENMEDMCIIRYKEGEYFKAHHDFFHTNTPNYEERVKNSGNRNFTCLIYLKPADRGGETNFPYLGKAFSPNAGTLLHWRNMIEQELQNNTLHEGLPVIKGEKWIASIWCRENKIIK